MQIDIFSVSIKKFSCNVFSVLKEQCQNSKDIICTKFQRISIFFLTLHLYCLSTYVFSMHMPSSPNLFYFPIYIFCRLFIKNKYFLQTLVLFRLSDSFFFAYSIHNSLLMIGLILATISGTIYQTTIVPSRTFCVVSHQFP